MNQAPIGIFDSGVGGLSVAREIRRRLPGEELLYFADTAFCPYGERPLNAIRSRSVAVVGHLVDCGVKMVVVACNTASGAALETLRERYELPIVGLEPAVKPAAERSRRRRIGVLATTATLRTERFHRLVERHGRDVEIVRRASPELVDLVEAGRLSGDEVAEALETALAPFREAGVDTLVLGCTHYPFLARAIADQMGPEVEVVDSGEAVARQVERILSGADAFAGPREAGMVLLTTGSPGEIEPVVRRLWPAPVDLRAVEL